MPMLQDRLYACILAACQPVFCYTTILILTVTLVACRTGVSDPPVVSLEEAKKITAEFTKRPFKPPPKTITDISNLLDQHRPDPARLRFLHVQANREIEDNTPESFKWRAYQNRGYFAQLAGRPDQALKDFRTALNLSGNDTDGLNLRTLRRQLARAEAAAGNFEFALDVLQFHHSIGHNRVLADIYTRIGDVDKAEFHATKALRLAARSGDQRLWSHAEPLLRARVLEAKGQWSDAEYYIRLASNRFLEGGHRSDDPNWLERNQLRLVGNLLKQGRLIEAEALVRDVLVRVLMNVGKYNLTTVETLKTLALVLIAEERYDDAKILSRATLDILKAMQVPANSRIMGSANHLLGKSLAAKGDWQAATSAFDRAKRGFPEDSFLYRPLYDADLDVSMALVRSGRIAEATSVLRDTIEYRRKRSGKDHYNTAEAIAVLAMARAAQGDLDTALQYYRQAIPVLVGQDHLSFAVTRTGRNRRLRLKTILEDYIDVLSRLADKEQDTSLRQDLAAEAFKVVDLAQGGVVTQALSASATRSLAEDKETAILVRGEQDTSLRIEMLEGHLSNALALSDNQKNEKVIQDLRNRLAKLRRARIRLQVEIENNFPQYADLVNPRPLTVSEVRGLLKPGEALVAVYEGKHRVYVWAIPKQGEFSFVAVKMDREELLNTVTLLRRALEPNVQRLGDIPDFDLATAYGLYARILKPVVSGWQDSENLLVVTQGMLGQLPLALLPTEPVDQGPKKTPLFSEYRTVPWLVRSHAITILPSIGSLKTVRLLLGRQKVRKRFVGFADPWFSPQKTPVTPQREAESSTQLAARSDSTIGRF